MKKLIIFILLILNSSFLKSQREVVDFLQVPEISEIMATKYLKPMAEMLNSNLQTGWYTTAKSHRFLGFDIAINLSVSNTPSNMKGYSITQIPKFDQYYTIKDGSFSVAANVAGETLNHPEVKSKDNGREIQLPRGEGVNKISLPAIVAGLGLPYNTELRLKLMPSIKNGDIGKIGQYGLGVKHSVKEYLPVLDDVPALSLAVFGAYSIASNDMDIEYLVSNTSGQMLEGAISAYTGRIILGIDVPVLSAYLGLGYGSTTIDYDLKGSYYLGDIALQQEEINPISMTYEYSGVQIDLGVKAKLGMVDLFAGYKPGIYRAFNVGAGVNFR